MNPSPARDAPALSRGPAAYRRVAAPVSAAGGGAAPLDRPAALDVFVCLTGQVDGKPSRPCPDVLSDVGIPASWVVAQGDRTVPRDVAEAVYYCLRGEATQAKIPCADAYQRVGIGAPATGSTTATTATPATAPTRPVPVAPVLLWVAAGLALVAMLILVIRGRRHPEPAPTADLSAVVAELAKLAAPAPTPTVRTARQSRTDHRRFVRWQRSVAAAFAPLVTLTERGGRRWRREPGETPEAYWPRVAEIARVRQGREVRAVWDDLVGLLGWDARLVTYDVGFTGRTVVAVAYDDPDMELLAKVLHDAGVEFRRPTLTGGRSDWRQHHTWHIRIRDAQWRYLLGADGPIPNTRVWESFHKRGTLLSLPESGDVDDVHDDDETRAPLVPPPGAPTLVKVSVTDVQRAYLVAIDGGATTILAVCEQLQKSRATARKVFGRMAAAGLIEWNPDAAGNGTLAITEQGRRALEGV